jgi:uncharacterized protein
MTNYLIVPGYGNSGPEHWQTYFENKLPRCVRIHQTNWDKPIMEDWVTNINKYVVQYDPETVVLISHSMGGIAIAHWANLYNHKIKGAMIVAPPDLENPFIELPIENFTPIPTTKLPFPSIVVASTNDYWATKERTTLFSQNWGSKLIFIGEAGHINADTGYTHWDEGLKILSTISDF